MKLTDEDHALLLKKYLFSLPLGNLTELAEGMRGIWYAQMNYGLSGQIEEDKDFSEKVKRAVARMLDSDKERISRYIQKLEV